jgi:hypothetical protein
LIDEQIGKGKRGENKNAIKVIIPKHPYNPGFVDLK